MESVDSFTQISLFGDTFTPVKSEAPKLPTLHNLPEFRVVRSSRRKRTMSAFRNNGIIEIHIPDRLSRRDEYAIIPEMIQSVLTREAKGRCSDEDLRVIALELHSRYLPEFHERASSITWRAMRERWGSCTSGDGTIRISLRLNGAPRYVIECVLLHELIHLRVPDHGAEFQRYLSRYEKRESAEAFLEGFEAGLAATPEQAAL